MISAKNNPGTPVFESGNNPGYKLSIKFFAKNNNNQHPPSIKGSADKRTNKFRKNFLVLFVIGLHNICLNFNYIK